MLNNGCREKMKSYDVDWIDIHIMDFLIYAYACNMMNFEIFDNNEKYMKIEYENINKIIILKKVNVKVRIRELIEKGFFDTKTKLVGKKTYLFIRPTELCIYIKESSDISYEDFMINVYQFDKKITKGETRHLYKDCEYVKFTNKELEDLKHDFPLDYEMRIINCENYCKSKGKSYHNYLATIRNWSRKEQSKKNNNGTRDFSKISF